MKKMMMVMCALGVISWVHAGAVNTLLFSDSYNRADSTDIDSSSDGMDGIAAPMVYGEAFEGSGVATSIQIISEQLNVARGVGMSSLYLDYNFTDEEILAADGFSVSMDVVTITSADDTANRFGGFGVGNTLAEAQAAGDSFDSSVPFRPSVARADSGYGVSDFYVDLALDGNLRLWSNGDLLNAIYVGVVAGTISVDFYMDDFNAGTTVTAVVYFDGVMQDIRTFTWDNDSANYIGISGRTAGAGVFLDNLSVSAIYENRAYNPSPADGEAMVDTASELSWYTGKDTTGAVNAEIAQHYLYLTDSTIDGDPNFASVSPAIVTDTTDPITSGAYTLASDKVYYWRVDESVQVNGGVSGPQDPNTIIGYVWSFDTYTYPVLDAEPQAVVLTAGSSAVFECTFTSVTEPTVTWFKEAGQIDTEMAGVIESLGDDTYKTTLTIASAAASDEGFYYCSIENASGADNAVVSETAGLGVKRQMAHWTLDLADLQGGQYVDISGEGHNADPNIVPDATSFVEGADPTETAEGLDVTVEPLSAAVAGTWDPAEFTNELTLSLWCRWNGTNGAYQGLITKRDYDNDNLASWYWEINPSGTMEFSNYTQGVTAAAPEIGEWTHLLVTVGADGLILYVNGEAVASNAAVAPVITDASILLGSNNRKSGILVAPFNGVLDDIQIYNYALSKTEVADLYYDVMETAVCLNLAGLDMTFDVAGGGDEGNDPDCRINIADFAAFASQWMNCGLYPESGCQ